MTIDLPSLLTRIESATGPDRELDTLLCVAFVDIPKPQGTFELNVWPPLIRYNCDWRIDCIGPEGVISSHTAPTYTAIALCERALPGLSPLVGAERSFGFDNDIPGAEKEPRWNAWCYGHSGQHPTSPRSPSARQS